MNYKKIIKLKLLIITALTSLSLIGCSSAVKEPTKAPPSSLIQQNQISETSSNNSTVIKKTTEAGQQINQKATQLEQSIKEKVSGNTSQTQQGAE